MFGTRERPKEFEPHRLAYFKSRPHRPVVKYLRLAVREPEARRNPLHTFLVEHEGMRLAQLWNWHETTDDDGYGDLLLFRVVGELAPYAAALDEAAFVSTYETARIDDESFYVYVEHETRAADHAFREPFLDRRVLTAPPIEFAANGETRMEIVGRAADVQAVVDGFPPAYETRVDRVSSYDRGMTAAGSLLTERQREALAVATELGYYDVPRTASVEDVAAELDCAASTASDHLRKAQARLARDVVGS